MKKISINTAEIILETLFYTISAIQRLLKQFAKSFVSGLGFCTAFWVVIFLIVVELGGLGGIGEMVQFYEKHKSADF